MALLGVVTALLPVTVGLLTSGTASASADNAHFSITYVQPTLSAGNVTWACAGEHIVNNGQGVRDVEDCSMTGPGTSSYVPGTYSGDPLGTFPGFPGITGFSWASDYCFAVFGNPDFVATSYQITVNGSSTRVHIDSSYPADC